MKKLYLSVLLAIFGLCSYSMVNAGEIEDLASIDFSLRFPSALSKFSSAGDVAGFGGASAASQYASGINPASIEWKVSPELPYSFSPQFSNIRFEKKSNLRISALTAGINTEKMGGFQVSASKTSSDENAQSEFLRFQGNYAQIQWGKKIQEDLAIGVNLNYVSFNTKAGFDGILLADGDSHTKGIKGGVLWAATSKVLAGLIIDYASEHSTTQMMDVDCFCLLPFADTSKSVLLRAGLSYEYADLSSLYLDYLQGSFHNPRSRMSSKTLFVGIEHQFFPWLFGRVGVSQDFRGFTGKTLGIGINPSKNISIDFAVQRDMFPELLPEFGHSTLLNISVNLSL
jgi:phage-related protein